MLSLNSSSEAARAGAQGRGFAVIATEIQRFSDQSKAANNESLITIKDLNTQINSVIGVRTADVAYDLIDKIDRNLFERNCDVQAWATFDRIVDYAMNPSEEKKKGVISLLHNLYEIYEVYYDIIMADKEGKIAGVLSTRFNWNYIYDILDKAKIGEHGEVYVVNTKEIVVASRDKEEILKRNLADTYSCVKDVVAGEEYGYVVEIDNDSMEAIIGYAHTKGYNSYPGKNWSVVVREIF